MQPGEVTYEEHLKIVDFIIKVGELHKSIFMHEREEAIHAAIISLVVSLTGGYYKHCPTDQIKEQFLDGIVGSIKEHERQFPIAEQTGFIEPASLQAFDE